VLELDRGWWGMGAR